MDFSASTLTRCVLWVAMIFWCSRSQSITRMAYRKSVPHSQGRSTRCPCSAPVPRQKGIRTDMAGRVLIGDNGIWTSRKLANLHPGWSRPEYAWLYPIAGPNSVFEYDPRAIWARAYAFARPDKSIEDVEAVLAAFVEA